jgi:hypothetical protein
MVSVSSMLTSDRILEYKYGRGDPWFNQYSNDERLESANMAPNIEILEYPE